MSSEVFKLLSTARREGVHVTLNNGDLALKISKGSSIEPALLQEIKDNKAAIITFLSNPNLLAASVDEQQETIPVFDRSLGNKITLSFSQERLWFIDQMEGTVQYHIPVVLRLQGNLNIEALSNALQQVVNRHESLRTVIRQADGEGYQYILPVNSWKLTISDGVAHGDEVAMNEYVHALIRQPFNLAEDHMLRAELIQLNTSGQLLVATMHHIASD